MQEKSANFKKHEITNHHERKRFCRGDCRNNETGERMNNNERRSEILRMLKGSEESISAAKLAGLFGVTRQIIVSDIALLRANGNKIIAARQGYYMEKDPAQQTEAILCRHNAERVLDEFYAVTDHGGTVVNVIVEHPIYGQLSAELNIASRYDAQEFVQKVKASMASQLCDLTGGLHIHMIRVPSKQAYERIVRELDAAGILVRQE